MSTLPTNAASRNDMPMADGLLYYFPNALAAVARVSKIGNAQHNGNDPMHWARNKSTDHANKIIRHLVDAGTMDIDGTRHSAKIAWRALALLEDELIAEGATPGRNARNSPDGNAARRLYDETSAIAAAQDAKLDGIPAESAYLASFSPNGSRIATPAEIDGLRDALSAEELRGFGIGDAEPRHPMHAEAIRDHDERLFGGEDRL